MNKIISIAFFVFLFISASGQKVSIGVGTGFSVYNGDLSHHHPIYSQHESNIAYTFNLGYKINDIIHVNTQLMRTKLEGNDQYASTSLKHRNLSFFTDITELSIYSDIHILPLLRVTDKWCSPFMSLGGGVFHFNPMTELNGIAYHLQGWNTEGQGLPGTKEMPYSLIEYSFQVGIGVNFTINKHINLSIGSRWRILTTDYLDDVSGAYYDLNRLEIYKGEIAAALAYRNTFAGSDKPESIQGTLRGNPKNNDSFIVHEVKIAYWF